MMFNHKFPPHDKHEAEAMAKSALADMLGEILLNDPNVPGKDKVAIRLVITAKNFEERLREYVMPVAEALRDNGTAEAEQKARDLLEYIQLMTAGFDTFIEAHNSGMA